MRHLLYLQLG